MFVKFDQTRNVERGHVIGLLGEEFQGIRVRARMWLVVSKQWVRTICWTRMLVSRLRFPYTWIVFLLRVIRMLIPLGTWPLYVAASPKRRSSLIMIGNTLRPRQIGTACWPYLLHYEVKGAQRRYKAALKDDSYGIPCIGWTRIYHHQQLSSSSVINCLQSVFKLRRSWSNVRTNVLRSPLTFHASPAPRQARHTAVIGQNMPRVLSTASCLTCRKRKLKCWCFVKFVIWNLVTNVKQVMRNSRYANDVNEGNVIVTEIVKSNISNTTVTRLNWSTIQNPRSCSRIQT